MASLLRRNASFGRKAKAAARDNGIREGGTIFREPAEASDTEVEESADTEGGGDMGRARRTSSFGRAPRPLSASGDIAADCSSSSQPSPTSTASSKEADQAAVPARRSEIEL